MTEPFEPLPPEEPPKETDKPKRLSFREANLGPEPKLAESKPLEPPPRPLAFLKTRKRTVAITLLAAGTGTAAIYGLTQLDSNCGQNSADQWTTGQTTPCTHGSGGWHGSYSFSFGGGSSSADASTASRGGFGSTGSAHGGGGE